MPLDALVDNIASLKLTHWRRCRAPLVKILCAGQFPLSFPDRRFSRSSRKSWLMPWHVCCSFHRAWLRKGVITGEKIKKEKYNDEPHGKYRYSDQTSDSERGCEHPQDFQTNSASHDPDRADSCIKGRRSMANFEKSIRRIGPRGKNTAPDAVVIACPTVVD